jgi:hypothetical protein
MRKAPCREDGWLTRQGFEIVAHRAHLAGPPLRRCCREVKVSTLDRGLRNPPVPPSRRRDRYHRSLGRSESRPLAIYVYKTSERLSWTRTSAPRFVWSDPRPRPL